MTKLAVAASAVVLATLLPIPTTCWAQFAKPTVPIQLKPASNAPVTLHMTDESKAIYLALGKAAGLNVIFDGDYQSRHGVQVDITNTTLADALRIVGEITGTSAKPLAPDTIFVFADTHLKHVDYDDQFDRTIFLKYSNQQADANEILTAIRNVLPPEAKVYLVASQKAIVMHTTEENIALAQKILSELDTPRKAYRLTYAVTEVDGDKRVGTQHFSMDVVEGRQTTLKQGSKVPIATGSYNPVATTGDHPQPAGVQTQFTYLDIGMNFDATLTAMENGAQLTSTIEQSSLAPETSGVGPQDPIVRQTVLKGTFLLTSGKPVMLGSIDMPGTTRRLDIEVAMERLP